MTADLAQRQPGGIPAASPRPRASLAVARPSRPSRPVAPRPSTLATVAGGLGHGAEHPGATGQGRAVGEAEGDAVAGAEVVPDDRSRSGRRCRRLGQPGDERAGVVGNHRVRAARIVASLQEPAFTVGEEAALDVDLAERRSSGAYRLRRSSACDAPPGKPSATIGTTTPRRRFGREPEPRPSSAPCGQPTCAGTQSKASRSGLSFLRFDVSAGKAPSRRRSNDTGAGSSGPNTPRWCSSSAITQQRGPIRTRPLAALRCACPRGCCAGSTSSERRGCSASAAGSLPDVRAAGIFSGPGVGRMAGPLAPDRRDVPSRRHSPPRGVAGPRRAASRLASSSSPKPRRQASANASAACAPTGMASDAAAAMSSARPLSFASSVVCARGTRSPAMARRMRSLPIQLCPLERSMTSSVRAEVEADAFGQRQRLGDAGEVDGSEQVVDELGAGAVAGARADAKQRDDDDPAPPWRSKTSSAQATIKLMLPSRARAGPPDIGASMQSMPRASSRTRSSRCSPARRRAEHDAAPACEADTTPQSPKSTASVCAASTTATITTPEPRANAAGVAQTRAPCAPGHRARVGATSRTLTRWPRRAGVRPLPSPCCRCPRCPRADPSGIDDARPHADALRASPPPADPATGAASRRGRSAARVGIAARRSPATLTRAGGAPRAAASAARARRACRSWSSRCRRGRAASAPRAGRRRG